MNKIEHFVHKHSPYIISICIFIGILFYNVGFFNNLDRGFYYFVTIISLISVFFFSLFIIVFLSAPAMLTIDTNSKFPITPILVDTVNTNIKTLVISLIMVYVHNKIEIIYVNLIYWYFLYYLISMVRAIILFSIFSKALVKLIFDLNKK